jgi:hypothetical protein
MNASMPPALAAYFSAEDDADVEPWNAASHRTPVVRDEGQVMRGLDAIKAWKSPRRQSTSTASSHSGFA